MVGCANPTVDGDIVVALADRIELLSTGEVLARFPHGADIRANDGACDSDRAALGRDDGDRPST